MNFFGKMKAQTSETVHNGRSLCLASHVYILKFLVFIYFFINIDFIVKLSFFKLQLLCQRDHCCSKASCRFCFVVVAGLSLCD